MTISFFRAASVLSLSLFALSCEQESTVETMAIDTPEVVYADLPTPSGKLGKSADGARYEVVMAEYITAGDSDEMGNTVLFNHRGKNQLDYDFAPGMSGDGTDAISYYIDDTRPSQDLTVDMSTAAVNRAMTTWEDATCSDLNMFQIPADGRPTGYIAKLLGYGGSYEYVADVVHNGWLPGAFFEQLFGRSGRSVLGVTFTLLHVDADGNFVDTNNDNKPDVAWREIYYNDRFNWATSIDIETVALHEAGHGLSQGHFGKAFRNKNGQVHFSPRAVMNAAYSGLQTEVDGTDKAGHCSIWGNWPNK
ncbi:hypothetical protein GGR26_002513 [Lewinella marina]|uniref:Peptidase M10 metallopeptidase domain-containing protein n=1 Tax=Neolewinella marina TaxID=438751 RepID=A0A2G0CC43_9BACT|nr:hypothetical protein [Neolewinella marina]NJB86736.1 hypothetical protein [Neolewinella marina]PHK97543.1 hypothetical protein CGL56_15710 [Neolewinella marina]